MRAKDDVQERFLSMFSSTEGNCVRPLRSGPRLFINFSSQLFAFQVGMTLHQRSASTISLDKWKRRGPAHEGVRYKAIERPVAAALEGLEDGLSWRLFIGLAARP